MPLEPINELMEQARQGRYAVGYFESWNLESLQGVIDAAEAMRSPVIIGFNGEFLTHGGRVAAERISWYGALGRAAADSAAVPCGFVFNECPDDASLRLAAAAGFNMVMLADPRASYDEYVRRAAELVRFAHSHGTAVEAEIGQLPHGAPSGKAEPDGSLTDPDLAAEFVEATRIDLLAVSVGNVHVMLKGGQALELDRLAEIRKRVAVPLALHGGTGITAESLRRAISLGVTNVAYGTCLKRRYLAAVRAAIGREHSNPHELLGIGGSEDVLVAGRLAVRDAVLERIELLGSCGRA